MTDKCVSDSYTAAEINEIREELKRFLSAMADMGVVMKKPQAQVDSIRHDGIPAIDILCDLAISALRGPGGEVERKAKLVDDMERIGLYPVNEPSLIEWAEREIRRHDNDAHRNAVTLATTRPIEKEKQDG